MPHHDNASLDSQKCCDGLVESLSTLIPNLKRQKSQETCGLFVPGKNRFAHIYHRGKMGNIRVYFRGDVSHLPSDPIIDVHRRDKIEKGWDKEFPFFASISGNEPPLALAKLLATIAYPLSDKKGKTKIEENTDSKLVADIEEIISNKTANPTVVRALVNARVGQGKFGLKVRKLWKYRCSVTGSSTKAALEASHIKGWADSTDAERLDPNNGLLLTANLHKLFDAGLISFENSGEMLVSLKLSETEREIFGLTGRKLTKIPSPKMANYLSHHRMKFFE